MRGFLLTRRVDFLEPYDSAKAALPPALARLRRLVSDDPDQTARLDTIVRRGDAWTPLAEARLDESRREEPVPLAESVEGKLRMGRIRAVMQDFIEAEEALRAARNRET